MLTKQNKELKLSQLIEATLCIKIKKGNIMMICDDFSVCTITRLSTQIITSPCNHGRESKQCSVVCIYIWMASFNDVDHNHR